MQVLHWNGYRLLQSQMRVCNRQEETLRISETLHLRLWLASSHQQCKLPLNWRKPKRRDTTGYCLLNSPRELSGSTMTRRHQRVWRASPWIMLVKVMTFSERKRSCYVSRSTSLFSFFRPGFKMSTKPNRWSDRETTLWFSNSSIYILIQDLPPSVSTKRS